MERISNTSLDSIPLQDENTLLVISKGTKCAKNLEEYLTQLVEVYQQLVTHNYNCNISNIVGNSVSIASSLLLFTPFVGVGAVGLVLGSTTSLGTTVVKSFLTSTEIERLKVLESQYEISLSDYGVILRQYCDGVRNMCQVAYGASKISEGFRVATLAPKTIESLRTIQHFLPAAQTTKRVGDVVKVGQQALGVTKVFAGVSIGFSIADILLTWTLDDSTCVKIKERIEELQSLLNEIQETLLVLKNWTIKS
jgi:hypothetical protein